MEAYGRLLARKVERAVASAAPIQLLPWKWHTERVQVPIRNRLYRAARAAGMLKRRAWLWTGDPTRRGPPLERLAVAPLGAIETEVGYLRLGELRIAAIPGELYPELLLGKVCDPAPAGADFPDAPIEPIILDQFPSGTRWMCWGLANDEIGYLIPKRQWDVRRPYAFGRDRAQYGEVNSCGYDAARIVLESLARCAKAVEAPASRKGTAETDPPGSR